jgi:hypothetical protein
MSRGTRSKSSPLLAGQKGAGQKMEMEIWKYSNERISHYRGVTRAQAWLAFRSARLEEARTIRLLRHLCLLDGRVEHLERASNLLVMGVDIQPAWREPRSISGRTGRWRSIKQVGCTMKITRTRWEEMGEPVDRGNQSRHSRRDRSSK